MKRVCYEVKTLRADFLSELKRHLKRRIGMRYSNEFCFVTPTDLVGITEIPPESGLVEAGYATFAEWKELIGRHTGFFSYDPETRAYCMIQFPHHSAILQVRHGNWSRRCSGTSVGCSLSNRPLDLSRSDSNSDRNSGGTLTFATAPTSTMPIKSRNPMNHDGTSVDGQDRPSCEC
jgi:hypothetical protein